MALKHLKHASQLDPGQVLKNVHDELGRSLRVSQANSKVPSGYSRVVLTTNAEGSVTEACFYGGAAAQKTRIQVVADVNGSLNNTAFRINNAENDPMTYVWYNVGGLGTDPKITEACGIEIPLEPNDPIEIVALSTARLMDMSEYFKAYKLESNLIFVENIELGATTSAVDINTGFTIGTLTEGVTKKIKSITLPEEPGIRYVFNHAEGKFETHLTDITVTIESGDAVDTPGILNIDAVAAATEYSFTLPAGTKRYQFQVRRGGATVVNYCFTSGETSTNFFTLPAGVVHYEEGLSLTAPLTFYFETSVDGKVLEVTYWT